MHRFTRTLPLASWAEKAKTLALFSMQKLHDTDYCRCNTSQKTGIRQQHEDCTSRIPWLPDLVSMCELWRGNRLSCPSSGLPVRCFCSIKIISRVNKQNAFPIAKQTTVSLSSGSHCCLSPNDQNTGVGIALVLLSAHSSAMSIFHSSVVGMKGSKTLTQFLSLIHI